MSDFPKLQPGVLEGAMQSLVDGARRVREVEGMVNSIIPLTDNEEISKKLEEVRETCAKAAFTLQSIYNRNAKEAFKP